MRSAHSDDHDDQEAQDKHHDVHRHSTVYMLARQWRDSGPWPLCFYTSSGRDSERDPKSFPEVLLRFKLLEGKTFPMHWAHSLMDPV